MVGAIGSAPGPLTQADAERWYDDVGREEHGWVIELDGRCVGVARLHSLDASLKQAHLAVGLFAPQNRGMGLGTEAVQLVLSHAFDTLELSVVRARVLAFNSRAIACYRRCGFREVAREPLSLDGEAAEDVLLEVRASEPGIMCD
jgi:RimJ/RimL family protein N-acetyltransferase